MRRRGFLALAAATTGSALTACSSSSATRGPATGGSPTSGPATAVSPGVSGAATAGSASPGASPGLGAGTSSSPRWADLARRIGGRLVLPGQASYEIARLSANPRFDGVRPAAIAHCASPADVAATIAFARESGVHFSVRAGGHCYGGWSTGPDLVLDVSAMSAVRVNRAVTGPTVTVGAGARLVDVYTAVAAAGLGIPAGSCPSVAVAGLTLGGGVGVLARTWGLTCDSVMGYDLVTADGRLRRVTPAAEPELFWAGRGGGGGSFGVVTAFTLRARPAPQVSTFYLRWPWRVAAAVVEAWQAWAPSTDRRLWSTCKLLVAGGEPRIFVAGTWTGTSAALAQVLSPLLSGAGAAPQTRTVHPRTYLAAMLAEAGCSGDASCHLPPRGSLAREKEAATSHMPTSAMTRAAISDLVAAVEGLGAPGGMREAGVSLDALGGAVADVGQAETAFAHRTSPFSVQYTATWDGAESPSRFDTLVREVRARMTPHLGNGAYVNYPDAALAGWQDAYWGTGYPHLQRIKAEVDPDGVFRFAQSVGA